MSERHAHARTILQLAVSQGWLEASAASSDAPLPALLGELAERQARTLHRSLTADLARRDPRFRDRFADRALVRLAQEQGLIDDATLERMESERLRLGAEGQHLLIIELLLGGGVLTPVQIDTLQGDVPDTSICSVCGVPGSTAASHCAACGSILSHREDRARLRGIDPGDPFLGRPLGNCLLLRKLGEGGMGVVYHGRHVGLDREVAVKVLPHSLSARQQFRERFVREARAAARVEHANLIRVLDVGIDGATHYLVMEFVDGASLGEVIADQGGMPLKAAIDAISQAMAGMAAAHAAGIVHRDLKPDNLMRRYDGAIKVADFGLARDVDGEGLSVTGAVMGTPGYMAPEQVRGEPVDHRCDLFSLGLTLHALISGGSPFSRGTAMLSMLATTDEPTPPLGAEHGVSAALDRWIAKMTAKAPADRFPDVGVASASLQAALKAPGEPAPAGLRRASSRELRPRSRRVSARRPASGGVHPGVWVGVAGVVLALIGLAVGLGGGKRGRGPESASSPASVAASSVESSSLAVSSPASSASSVSASTSASVSSALASSSSDSSSVGASQALDGLMGRLAGLADDAAKASAVVAFLKDAQGADRVAAAALLSAQRGRLAQRLQGLAALTPADLPSAVAALSSASALSRALATLHGEPEFAELIKSADGLVKRRAKGLGGQLDLLEQAVKGKLAVGDPAGARALLPAVLALPPPFDQRLKRLTEIVRSAEAIVATRARWTAQLKALRGLLAQGRVDEVGAGMHALRHERGFATARLPNDPELVALADVSQALWTALGVRVKDGRAISLELDGRKAKAKVVAAELPTRRLTLRASNKERSVLLDDLLALDKVALARPQLPKGPAGALICGIYLYLAGEREAGYAELTKAGRAGAAARKRYPAPPPSRVERSAILKLLNQVGGGRYKLTADGMLRAQYDLRKRDGQRDWSYQRIEPRGDRSGPQGRKVSSAGTLIANGRLMWRLPALEVHSIDVSVGNQNVGHAWIDLGPRLRWWLADGQGKAVSEVRDVQAGTAVGQLTPGTGAARRVRMAPARAGLLFSEGGRNLASAAFGDMKGLSLVATGPAPMAVQTVTIVAKVDLLALHDALDDRVQLDAARKPRGVIKDLLKPPIARWGNADTSRWTRTQGSVTVSPGSASEVFLLGSYRDFRLRAEYRLQTHTTHEGQGAYTHLRVRGGRVPAFQLHLPQGKPGAWQQVEIVAAGERVSATLDGLPFGEVRGRTVSAAIAGEVRIEVAKDTTLELRRCELVSLDGRYRLRSLVRTGAMLRRGRQLALDWYEQQGLADSPAEGTLRLRPHRGEGVALSVRAFKRVQLSGSFRVEPGAKGRLHVRWDYHQVDKPVDLGSFPQGRWHTLRLIDEGARVVLWVDGTPQSPIKLDANVATGVLRLEAVGGSVELKDLRVKER